MLENLRIVLPDLSDGPCPTVLLRHEMPDGSWHVDWMIAREATGSSSLVSFRLSRPLDACENGEIVAAEHIGDHRTAYLAYEGPVSGDRGHVSRLRSGSIVHLQPASTGLSCRLDVLWSPELGCDARSQHIELTNKENSRWSVKILETKPNAGTIIKQTWSTKGDCDDDA